MIAEKQTKCANYIRIIAILKNLRDIERSVPRSMAEPKPTTGSSPARTS